MNSHNLSRKNRRDYLRLNFSSLCADPFPLGKIGEGPLLRFFLRGAGRSVHRLNFSPSLKSALGERTAGSVPKKRLVNELNPFLASKQHLHLGESRYWRSHSRAARERRRESLARALSLSSLRLP